MGISWVLIELGLHSPSPRGWWGILKVPNCKPQVTGLCGDCHQADIDRPPDTPVAWTQCEGEACEGDDRPSYLLGNFWGLRKTQLWGISYHTREFCRSASLLTYRFFPPFPSPLDIWIWTADWNLSALEMPPAVGGPVGYTPPDGGWGWAVVVGAFISIGFSYAFAKSITVFFKEIEGIFHASTSEVSWISSIMLAVMYGGGKYPPWPAPDFHKAVRAPADTGLFI